MDVYTPKEIGRMLGGINEKHVNDYLARAGFQYKNEKYQWVLDKAAERYTHIKDDGSIEWTPYVIQYLIPMLRRL